MKDMKFQSVVFFSFLFVLLVYLFTFSSESCGLPNHTLPLSLLSFVVFSSIPVISYF